jgi:hypothetical protein
LFPFFTDVFALEDYVRSNASLLNGIDQLQVKVPSSRDGGIVVQSTNSSKESILFYFKNKKRSGGNKDAVIIETKGWNEFIVMFPTVEGLYESCFRYIIFSGF